MERHMLDWLESNKGCLLIVLAVVIVLILMWGPAEALAPNASNRIFGVIPRARR